MLDISKPLTAGKTKSYYREQYSAASNNYYSQNGELPGRWHGALTTVLGLSATVTAEAFDRLAEGRHPITGEQLIRHRPPAHDKPVDPWLKDNEEWKKHLEDKYVAALTDGRSVLLGADALPEPNAVAREITGIAPPDYTERQKALIEMHEIAARIFRDNLAGPDGEKARHYLESRGVTSEVAAEFQIGLAPRGNQLLRELQRFGPEMIEASGLFYKTESGRLLDRFIDRVMIPIQDPQGNIIAFAGRDLYGTSPAKYVNSPGTEIYKKSEVLFNAHRAKNQAGSDDRVVAVEGYMDAISTHAAGVPAVAICGTCLTEPQAKMLGSMAQKTILNMDSDQAGKMAAKRNLEMLIAAGVPARALSLQTKDADEFIRSNGAEKYRAEVACAQSAIHWLSLQAACDMAAKPIEPGIDRAYAEAAAMRGIVDVLAAAPESMRRDLSNQLAAYLGEAPPIDKEQGHKPKPIEHRAGWDLTFNAPKTLSVTALVGGDERVREAHQFAVKASLDLTQRYVQARMGGNNQAQTTGKWIAALFDHDTARPVDGYPAPHLHTHAVVFNMTEDETGRARSLQPYELFRIQTLSTAAYQSELAHRLRNLGYEITRGTNRAPDIKGYTREYLDHESLRHGEMQAELATRGLHGREAESIVVHQQRESKIRYTPDELLAIHRAHAAEHGNQPERVVARALARSVRMEPEEGVSIRAKAAVDFARERLSERNSVFDHFEVLRDALHHSGGRVRLNRIEDEIQRQWDEGRFNEVHHVRRLAPGHRFTTPEAIAHERGMIEQVLASAKSLAPLPLDKNTIRLHYPNLNDDQKWLVYRALTATEQILGVQGSAGTGKTTALRAIREQAELYGYRAHGLGPTSKARKGVIEAGIESETVQRYLIRDDDRRARDTRPVLFVLDESSLVATRQMHDFFATVRPGDRVLVMGDRKQHQSVEAGRAFEQLQDAGMRVIQLNKIVRQRDESLRKVVELLRAGQVLPAVEMLDESGRIHQVQHRGHRLEAIAKNYAANPEGALVISPDNNSRQKLNAIIREKLRELGGLGPDVVEVRIMIPRQDVTGADRALAQSYRVGDQVRYLKGSETLGIEPKSYAEVTAVDAEQNTVTVQLRDSRSVSYDPARLRGVAIYEVAVRRFAVGDRIQFTTPWLSQKIATRDTATIEQIDSSGNIRARMDESGRLVSWNAKQNRHIDHAYAMTSFSSQGMTVDRVLVHIDTGDTRNRALIDQTLGYVAISRPRFDAQIYTDSKEQIAFALSRIRRNTTALAPEQTAEYKKGDQQIGIGA